MLPALWIISSRIKCRTGIILHTAHTFVHNLLKHVVRGIQHLLAASEIPVQIDPLLLAVCLAVCIIFFHKQFRSGEAETVNTLFDISYHKHIVTSAAHSRHTGQNRFLDQVAVLILVDHHFLKLLLIFSRHSRWYQTSVFFFCQNLQGKLLHVLKINHIAASLFLCKQPCKGCHKKDQFFHGTSCISQIFCQFLGRFVKTGFLQIFYHLLGFFPQHLHCFFLLWINRLILFGRKPLPCNLIDLPVKCFKRLCLFHSLDHHKIRFQRLCIQIRSVRLLTDMQRLIQQNPCPLQVLTDTFDQDLYKSSVRKMFVFHLIIVHTRIQPLFRLWIAARIFV